jgi:uncharacterized lipoprotein YmbA
MKRVILFAAVLFAGCGSLPKPGPQAALYDFGIAPASPLANSGVRLGAVEAAPGLGTTEMRYRLAYQDASRVLWYTESRWAAAPSRLLARRFSQRLQQDRAAPCSVNITVEAFEQIFDSPRQSRGLVRLQAGLMGTGQKTPLTFLAETDHLASSADARGGVAALTTAADAAFAQVIDWAGKQPSCQAQPQP